MDEVLFRGTRKFENLQVQVELAANKSKDALYQLTQQTKSAILETWNSSRLDNIKQQAQDLWIFLVTFTEDLKEQAIHIANPRQLYNNLLKIFGNKWTKRDLYFCCTGIIVGGVIGIAVGLALRKKEKPVHYMQAIQCNHYLGSYSATVVEDAIAPFQCGEDDVLINVKAGSVQIVDALICSGYGKTLRRILRKLNNQSSSDLPIILGRDCAGIVVDLGSNVTNLDVGDEVWATVPFWSQGLLSQTVLISQHRVARKPKNIGFEGASSLPYAGSIALSALRKADLNLNTAVNKNILIQGGCTPVGCVLIQILKYWNANITTTCYKRALPVAKALGASDIIILPEINENEINSNVSKSVLYKELELKNSLYDLIINTRDCQLSDKLMRSFCTKEGLLVSTISAQHESDTYGVIGRLFLNVYIHFKFNLMRLLGLSMDEFDESHLCSYSLNELTQLVEDGGLQTVVDKVFHPHDIEMALAHIQSNQSIGSTVITFR